MSAACQAIDYVWGREARGLDAGRRMDEFSCREAQWLPLAVLVAPAEVSTAPGAQRFFGRRASFSDTSTFGEVPTRG